MNTIEEAKKYLRENWEEGIDCPCCTQFVKLYKRMITSSMARVLILMHQYSKLDNDSDGWLHVENYIKKMDVPMALRGDFPKLKYWGLIEQYDGLRDDGSNRNGYHRITDKGKEYALGRISLPKYARIFNKKCYGFSEESVFIQDSLGNKFNYRELMEL